MAVCNLFSSKPLSSLCFGMHVIGIRWCWYREAKLCEHFIDAFAP